MCYRSWGANADCYEPAGIRAVAVYGSAARHLLLATAPRYCQYYNQLHQLRWLLFLSRLTKASKKSWKSLYPAVAQTEQP